jgi:predicted nucleic acid-binding protein
MDSSAIVKLVVDEEESAALRAFLRGYPTRASCGLARVEVPRAVVARGAPAVATAYRILQRLDLVSLDDALLDAAGGLRVGLRSLDAIHVAAARGLGEDLECVVTYDRHMAAAATELGMTVATPA